MRQGELKFNDGKQTKKEEPVTWRFAHAFATPIETLLEKDEEEHEEVQEVKEEQEQEEQEEGRTFFFSFLLCGALCLVWCSLRWIRMP